jgi:hypothetical protein
MDSRTQRTSVVLGASAALIVALVALSRVDRDEPRPPVEVFDLRHVGPGVSESVLVDGRELRITVPAGLEEGATYGTVVLSRPGGPGPNELERDGSLESLHVADLDADGVEDALLTIRNGGSGSYVQMFVLLSGSPEAYVPRELPAQSAPGVDGYCGHDRVRVRDGVVERRVATFRDAGQASDPGVGTGPREADTNAAPGGAERALTFDLASWTWRPGS